MYADDFCVASRHMKGPQICMNVSIWCQDNRISVNAMKTDIMKFRQVGRTGKYQARILTTKIITYCSTVQLFQPNDYVRGNKFIKHRIQIHSFLL